MALLLHVSSWEMCVSASITRDAALARKGNASLSVQPQSLLSVSPFSRRTSLSLIILIQIRWVGSCFEI